MPVPAQHCRCREMSDSGYDDAGCVRQVNRRGRAVEVRTDCREAFSDRCQVAGAVVDQRDTAHSRPFVDGRTFASRRSFEHANLNARAKALNTASIW